MFCVLDLVGVDNRYFGEGNRNLAYPRSYYSKLVQSQLQSTGKFVDAMKVCRPQDGKAK